MVLISLKVGDTIKIGKDKATVLEIFLDTKVVTYLLNGKVITSTWESLQAKGVKLG